MNFSTALTAKLDYLHLLKHPFYKSWNEGGLTIETLQLYAKEYYPHVYRFPQYLSTIHSLCPEDAGIKTRQILLGNLIDEEVGDENHPELWLRFTEALGVERVSISKQAQLATSKALADGYFELTRSGYATGLGAIFAYEGQTAEISKSKIEGLQKHYGFDKNNDKAKALQFFEVHMKADEWHTQEIAELIDQLGDEDKKKAELGAIEGAKLLWGFLDGIMDTVHCGAAA